MAEPQTMDPAPVLVDPAASLVVIEKLGRSGEVAERLRRPLQANDSLAVGRGYDCDLMLDDPFVAALHLRVHRDAAGRLWVEDAGSRNGVRDERGRPLPSRTAVSGTLALQVGHSILRIHDGAPSIEPERALPLPGPSWLQATSWLLLAVGLGALSDWLQQIGEIKAEAFVAGGVMAVLITVIWSFGWSLANRLFAHQLRFARHLRVAAVGSALATVLLVAVPNLAYAFSAEALSHYAFIGYWLCFAFVCWLHLRVIGTTHLRLKAGVVLLLAASAILVKGMENWVPQRDGDSAPRYLGQLGPATLRIAPERPLSGFIDQASALQAELDAARIEAEQREGE
jgi:hypothetical protein